MALKEEISKQSSKDFVTWFLLTTLTQIYNEKEQGGQIQIVQFEEKRTTRQSNVVPSSALKKIKKKKSKKGLTQNKGVVPFGQDTAQLNTQVVKRN